MKNQERFHKIIRILLTALGIPACIVIGVVNFGLGMMEDQEFIVNAFIAIIILLSFILTLRVKNRLNGAIICWISSIIPGLRILGHYLYLL